MSSVVGTSEYLAQVAEDLAQITTTPDPEAFVGAYLGQHVVGDDGSVPVGRAGRQAAAHLDLGRTRHRGEDLVALSTPSEKADGWSAGGSTLLQVVTDDRPFIVDTVSTALTELGWSIRAVRHPILVVRRDAHGVLAGVAPHGTPGGGEPESWMTVEAYPPLGTAAEDLRPATVARVQEGLAASRLAHDDDGLMHDRLLDAIHHLEETPQPVVAAWVRRIGDLLRWMADDHFELLGYREYTVDGDTFTPVEGTGLGLLRDAGPDVFDARQITEGPEVMVVTKDSRHSPVHRAGYLDYVAIRDYDRQGRLVGERRFLGLWSSRAYSEPVESIPLVKDKAQWVWEALDVDPSSHSGQLAREAMASLPRDNWFADTVDDLVSLVRRIAGVHEQRHARLLVQRAPHGRFWSCFVYVPRDRYRTITRERITALLKDRLGGENIDFRALVNESSMARLLLIVKRPDGAPEPDLDLAALEAEVVAATLTWDDEFNVVADALPAEERGVEFGEAYESAYTAKQALADLRLANTITSDDDLRFALFKPDRDDDPADLRFKVITKGTMSLSRVMPHLDALGLQVIDERPFSWDLRGDVVNVYDFGFMLPPGQTFDDWQLHDRARFAEAFEASYTGQAHAGQMNRLVMGAGLTWVQVSWLRGIARYLQQAGIPYSQQYVAAALNANPEITAALVAAFESRFDPAQHPNDDARNEDHDLEVGEILRALDAVESLDQDRILRMFVAVMRAIKRTNAFAEDRPALAFKIAPGELDLLPEPRPAHEVFVYSPRVQGVHLRFGSVARGGLRWSDRAEDFRTEVLGLVKAQMVKNTVIVPVGAKGGFVPARLPDPRVDRAAWLAEGTACYEIFISSLLSLTDNLVDGEVVPPPDVVRHDGDDTYLVVAADKGTATFSDTANRIALERGFWLGDAFASGGSVGYDHKGMGITARGAWESVKRHFYEVGVDCQAEDFTCVGIGDMAGDVFGNGMLLSEHTRLVAAFNHMHVFLDPTPDAAASFAERKRLFELPRSTWADYDEDLISAGGGVFPRTAKTIPVTPQVQEALGLDAGVKSLTPTEMIRAILLAPVDLLWNGGIGTYVKASDETHAEVGDKTNDAVRVDGRDVRARIAGEGGNLGWTQRGRIEFAQAGGRVNTDFIDNSAGVDTSDHEVNIKVLLQPEVAAGRLDPDDRVALLASMTDEVAQLVLTHNVDQNIALSTEQAQDDSMGGAHEAWMRSLEKVGLLDRELESLPSRAEMARRLAEGEGLTRPELAMLLAWTKIHLEALVNDSTLPDDPYLADRLVTYFPRPLRNDQFADALQAHPLKREIVTMVTVNRFVNSQGITAFSRLAHETSSSVAEIVRAQLAARTIFAVARDELAVAEAGVPAEVELQVRVALQQMIERATRWLLHNRRGELDIKGEAAVFTDAVAEVSSSFDQLATAHLREQTEEARAALLAAGVPEDLARTAGQAPYLHLALAVVDLATRLGRPLEVVAEVFFGLAEHLGLDKVADRVNELPRTSRWDTMARAALRDDLTRLHSDLARAVLERSPEATAGADAIEAWVDAAGGVEREAEELVEIASEEATLARMSVALRTIRTLLV
ncbi:NAD-glutamate dehydrogenase [Propioniciclava sp. MC1683]|uniref:NAD-glutamate dehydrogenase n=1 Tax=Propioniciclava sp. MC1683 TaxID=2760309 RepID=UPI0016030004|nr:NAD-glutamate dehydrogenase [Propioniciclava sp. MC1683]MBB1502187.1 NAD-glutamate dehydrogenase [Propioniciclava sp. MC1683]